MLVELREAKPTGKYIQMRQKLIREEKQNKTQVNGGKEKIDRKTCATNTPEDQ